MAKSQKNIHPDLLVQELKELAGRELSPDEVNLFLDSDLERDALEGFIAMKKAGINNDKVLVDLKHQLNQKIKNKERFRELPWQKLSVAATIATVLGIGAFYIIKKQQHEQQLIAERTEVPKMLSKNDTLLIYLPDERILHTPQIAKNDLKRFSHGIGATTNDAKKLEEEIVLYAEPPTAVAAAPILAETTDVRLQDSNYMATRVSKELSGKVAGVQVARAKAFKAEAQLIKGHVLDIISSEPIEGVLVSINGTSTQIQSDEKGNFQLSVENNQQLTLTKKGYSSASIKASEITDGTLTYGLLPDIKLMADKAVKDYLASAKNQTEQAKLAVSGSAYQIYINKHINYPKAYTEMGQEGTVELEFTVNKDGSLSNFNVLRSMGAEFDNPSLKVIKEGPKWLPALKNGKPVVSRQRHYVNFIHL